MTTALDSFRDPPLEIEATSIQYLAGFTGGFTGGPPCNPQLDDVAGNNAYFNYLCSPNTNFPPSGQAQPVKAFFGRLFDFTGITLTCPVGVWTRLPFSQYQTNTGFVAENPPHYDRLLLPTYSSPDLILSVFVNVAANTPFPTSVMLGIIDDTNNIDVAIEVNQSIGYAGTFNFLASSGSAIGIAVNPTGNPFIVNNTVNWPTFEVFIIGQL